MFDPNSAQICFPVYHDVQQVISLHDSTLMFNNTLYNQKKKGLGCTTICDVVSFLPGFAEYIIEIQL